MSQVPVKRSRTASRSPESAGLASPRARRRSNSHLPEDRSLSALGGRPGTAGRHQEGSSASGSGGGGSAGTASTRGGSLAGYAGPATAPSPLPPPSLPYSGLPPPPALNAPGGFPHGPGSLHRQQHPSMPPADPHYRPGSAQQVLPSLHSATGWTSTTNFPMQGGSGDPRGERESSEGSTIGTRDSGRDRQPRSMMACIRCRKQKMKCDGPGSAPCRGCRTANVTCVFETRTRQRPKSISAMANLQPLPAIMTTGGPMAAPIFANPPRSGLDTYHLAGISSAQGLSARRRDSVMTTSSSGLGPQAQTPPVAPASIVTSPPLPSGLSGYPGPPTAQATPRASQSISVRHPGALPGGQAMYSTPSAIPPSNPVFAGQAVRPESPMAPPLAPNTESRLRNLESSMRAFDPLPSRMNTLQSAVARLEAQQDQLVATVNTLNANVPSPPAASARPTVQLSEQTWDIYRSYICPLTPWLPMLSTEIGLSGEVVACLTARVDPNVKDADSASGRRVRAEIGRLYALGARFSDSDLSALGVFATWDADDALTCSAVGQVRAAGKHRSLEKGPMRDARIWSELLVLEHLAHTPDFLPCLSTAPTSAAWRNRVSSREPTSPAARDRDIKLLAWLEYAEILAETQRILADSMTVREVADPTSPRSVGPNESRASAAQWEAARTGRSKLLETWNEWNAQWGGSGDPILALHFHYAILLVTSPLLYPDSANAWSALAQDGSGYEQMERARDAAIELIRAICSPEISRTLPYSFPIFRSRLAFGVAHLVAHTTALQHSPITPLPHIQSVLRLAYERLGGGQPSQWPATTSPPVLGSLLVEIVDGGDVPAVGRREILGKEMGRELWRRLVGGGA